MIAQLGRYVLTSVASPFLKAMAVAVAVLTLEEMLRLFDVIVADHGPARVVWRMLLNLLPEYFGLAIPVGFLLGVLLAFRGLAESNALDAMYAAGVSLKRLIAPVCGLSLLLMSATLVIVGFIQPYSSYEFERLGFLLQNGAFGLRIKAGEFTPIDDDTSILIGEIDPLNGEYRRIFIEHCHKQRDCSVVTATRAKWGFSINEREATLKLYDGRQLTIFDASTPSGLITFKTMDFPVSLPVTPPFRRRGEISNEASLLALARAIHHPAASGTELFFQNRAQFHWIILHSLTFLSIPFLGCAFGVVGKRANSMAGVVVGLLVLIAYIQFLKAGAFQVANGASPWLVMWPIFGALLAVSLSAFFVTAERPGGLNSFHIVAAAHDAITAIARSLPRLYASRP
jgi:lipopolysaccharide export system permease protein